jgi:hypothetical protein
LRAAPIGNRWLKADFMQLCKMCRSLMIGHEAWEWRERLTNVLRHHGAVPETLVQVAESLGPMCDKCRKDMDKWIKEE